MFVKGVSGLLGGLNGVVGTGVGRDIQGTWAGLGCSGVVFRLCSSRVVQGLLGILFCLAMFRQKWCKSLI